MSNIQRAATNQGSQDTTATNNGTSNDNDLNVNILGMDKTGSSRNFGRRNERGGNRNNQTSSQFVPKLSTVESLGTLKESKRQDFNKFHKSIHHHVMTTYKNSKDMSKYILDFIEPVAEIENEMKTLSNIRTSKKIYALAPPNPGETPDEKVDREQENDDRREMV